MLFLEERLPEYISYGANFKHKHAVQIQTTQNGDEFRRMLHPFLKVDYQVTFKNDANLIMGDIVNFYQKTNGKLRGFRFKDFADFSTNNYVDAPTSTDMPILEVGFFPATEYVRTCRVVRYYGNPDNPYCIRRIIKKIVAGTLLIRHDNGVDEPIDLVEDEDFTLSENGLISLTGWYQDGSDPLHPTIGYHPQVGTLTAGCEFDIPCRFDSEPTTTFINANGMEVTGISLSEIFNPDDYNADYWEPPF